MISENMRRSIIRDYENGYDIKQIATSRYLLQGEVRKVLRDWRRAGRPTQVHNTELQTEAQRLYDEGFERRVIEANFGEF